MEHPYILPYIKQRLTEMGFQKFHYDTVRIESLPLNAYVLDMVTNVVTDNNRYGSHVAEIDASNQFYYLVEKTISPTLKITSDTGYLLPSEAANYSNYTFHNFREFTGQIFITDLASFDLEFIRAIPYE